MLGGLRPDGSNTTLNPDTMFDGLAAKNFDIDQVQPNSIASLAAILSFLSRSSKTCQDPNKTGQCLR